MAPGTTGAAGGNEDLGAPLEPGGEVTQIGMVFDAIGRGDGSFNDSAARGYDAALEQLGVEGNEQVPAADGSDRADKLSLLCEDGYNPVLAVGFLFTEPLTAVAAECPDTSFGIVDSVVDAPNVSSLVFAEHQGSFLVGAAAALKSESGHIGFIGGLEGDLIRRFEAGYEAGAQAVNPDIEIESSTSVPPSTAFTDPAGAKTSTEAMIEAGVDVIYAAAGQSGLGMFEAVKEANDAGTTVWAIGVDSDQGSEANAGVPNDVKPYILTSMIKRVDVAVFETIRDVNEGDFTGGGADLRPRLERGRLLDHGRSHRRHRRSARGLQAADHRRRDRGSRGAVVPGEPAGSARTPSMETTGATATTNGRGGSAASGVTTDDWRSACAASSSASPAWSPTTGSTSR